MRRKQVGSAFPGSLPERVAVVRLVSDHSFRTGPRPPRPFPGDFDLLECLFGEPDLCWRSRVGIASQRKTLAIDHHHTLCSLSPFGLSDRETPFFAWKKLASMKDSSQSSTPLASNSERKALHISFGTSASYHSLRRRQQVEGCGYLSGRSFRRAPVLSIHRIPSKTKRSSALGRPPFRRGGGLGMRGSIFFHCSSVRYTTRLLTGLTSGELNIPKISGKQTVKSLAISRGYCPSEVLQPLLIRILASPTKINTPRVRHVGEPLEGGVWKSKKMAPFGVVLSVLLKSTAGTRIRHVPH